MRTYVSHIRSFIVQENNVFLKTWSFNPNEFEHWEVFT